MPAVVVVKDGSAVQWAVGHEGCCCLHGFMLWDANGSECSGSEATGRPEQQRAPEVRVLIS